MNLFTETQMTGMTREEQARKAILHVLNQIHHNPDIGWYLGIGTQSFALLTEAAATLFGEPLQQVRERFVCPNAQNPRGD